MSERDPIPVDYDGINVHAILDGRVSSVRPRNAVEAAGRPVTVWVDYRFVVDDGTFIPAQGKPHGAVPYLQYSIAAPQGCSYDLVHATGGPQSALPLRPRSQQRRSALRSGGVLLG
ncbi:hypothetical protein RDE2_35460 [Rhodococcus sp. RDE2]|nr:hypothetical protein RDE2_35460 [Rhodococcus sp. RDE2]